MNKLSYLPRIVQVLVLVIFLNRIGMSQQLYGQQDILRGNETNVYAERDGNTGVPSITIPLFSEFPVSLSYDASGIKPDQLSTEVGLGWNLQAGGEVRRNVRGLRDEEGGHPVGLSTQEKAQWNTLTSSANAQFSSTLQSAVEGYETSRRDLAPDEFSYDVMGRSGKFIMVMDANSNYVALSSRKIKVSFTSGPSYRFTHDVTLQSQSSIGSITIVFEDGVRCVFAQPETSTNDIAPVPNGSRTPDPITIVNTWKVTQITIPGQVAPTTFTYALIHSGPTRHYSDEMAISSSSYVGTSMLTAKSGISTVNTQSLIAISSATFGMIFEYSLTNNQQYVYPLLVLKNASLYAKNGKLASKYEFRYSRVGNTRILLSSVEKLGAANGTIKSAGVHQFEYNTSLAMPEFDYFTIDDFYQLMRQNALANTTNTAPPLSNTAGVDWWGYYNGTTTPYNSLIFQSSPQGQSLSITAIDLPRDPNPSVSQSLILQKIIYPSGGYTQYVFENNDYSYIPPFGYNSLGANVYGPITPAGGLRIKQIVNSDGLNSAKDIVKTFEYRLETDASYSSGVLPNAPLDLYNFNSPAFNDTQTGYTYNSFSLDIYAPFSLAPTGLSYSCIKEINGDGSYTIYNYSTRKDYFSIEDYWAGSGSTYLMQSRNQGTSNAFSRMIHPFVRGKSQNDCMIGLLLGKKDYSANNNLVKQITFTYARHDVGTFTDAFEQYFLPARPAYAYGCYCSRGQPYNPSFPDNNAADWHFWRAYNIYVAFPKMTQKVEQLYDQNSTTKFRQAQTNYTINPTNFQPSRIVATDITGKISAEEFYYSSDYSDLDPSGIPQMNGAIATMRQNNIMSAVIEHRLLKNLDAQYLNGKVVKGELTECSSLGLPLKNYVLESTAPISSLAFDNQRYLLNSQYYKAREEFIYDPTTYNLISKKKTNGPPMTTIWGYNNSYPVASIVGALPSIGQSGQVFYTSFEDERYVTSSSPVHTGGKTGAKHWEGAFSVPLPNVPGSYKLTYWRASATIAQPWTYQEDDIVITNSGSNTSRTIGVGDWIDEVRLYPVGALVRTQTYEPLYGVTSSMDHNGVQQIVEYDALGRKSLLKDNNADIAETYTYGKVSQFTCTVTFSGPGIVNAPTTTREVMAHEGFDMECPLRLNNGSIGIFRYRLDGGAWIDITLGESIRGTVVSYNGNLTFTFADITANHTLEIGYQ